MIPFIRKSLVIKIVCLQAAIAIAGLSLIAWLLDDIKLSHVVLGYLHVLLMTGWIIHLVRKGEWF